MSLVYVARKTNCRHIVAVFPQNMPVKSRAEVMKQFTLAGYDLEVADDAEVRENFATVCDCNRPPLLNLIGQAAQARDQDDGEPIDDDGVDVDSVDALAEEAQAEGVEEAVEAVVDEAVAAEGAEEAIEVAVDEAVAAEVAA